VICFLEGKLVKKGAMEAVVEVAGIGYLVRVPLSTSRVLPDEGESVRLSTCYMIRDENPELYGFSTEQECAIFQKLITLPRVGPRLAMRILSALNPDDLVRAIAAQDIDLLRKTPGIGKKLAERLIVELKDQFEGVEVVGARGRTGELIADAVEALIVLGYKRGEALALAKKAELEFRDASITLEDFLKEILKRT
jgi:Holliday junction DNA helicase RuvA